MITPLPEQWMNQSGNFHQIKNISNLKSYVVFVFLSVHPLALNDEIKNKMAARIETLQQNLPSCQLPKPEIPSMSNMTPQLEEAIRKNYSYIGKPSRTFRERITEQ